MENQKKVNYLESEDWKNQSEEIKEEVKNIFIDKEMIHLFEHYKSLSFKEVNDILKKDKFNRLLREINIKHYLFPVGWEFEEENEELFVSDYYFDFEEFKILDNYLQQKSFFDNLFSFRTKKDYFNYNQIKDLINYLENPPVKKVKKTVHTYLMTDASGYVKIGKSNNIYDRFLTLRVGNPTLRIIAHLDKNIESQLHKQYAPYRFLGEWFELPKLILDGLISEYEFSIHQL